MGLAWLLFLWLLFLITWHSRVPSLIPAGFISGLPIKLVLYRQLLINWGSPSNSTDKSEAACAVWSHLALHRLRNLPSPPCFASPIFAPNSLTAMNENMHAWLRIWSPLVQFSQRISDDMLFECHLEAEKRTTVQKHHASAFTVLTPPMVIPSIRAT